MGNTQFFAALSNSQWPDRLQQISPGNATDLVASQSLVAVTDLGDNALLSDVVIAPVICTPNGDGINDRIDISAKVFSIQEGGQLRVELFDLSGKRLRSLGRERARSKENTACTGTASTRAASTWRPALTLFAFVWKSTQKTANETWSGSYRWPTNADLRARSMSHCTRKAHPVWDRRSADSRLEHRTITARALSAL